MSQPYILYHCFGHVVRVSDGKIVAPAQSVDDPDFKAYNDWAQAGNQPDDDLTVPVDNLVPLSVTKVQLCKALNQMGVRAFVDTAVASAAQDIKDEWEYSTDFSIGNSDLLAYAGTLGLDVQQVFLLASTF